MWHDLQYSFRSFIKNPGFTLIAVLTVALGVGPNSAIFSIINAVLLRPLPYRDSDRLVMLLETNKSRGFAQLPVSGATFTDWQRDSRSFEQMAPAFTISEYGFNVTAGRDPERAQGGQAAANLLDVLGVKPIVGRSFLAEEDGPGGTPVALISQSFWTRRFAASRDIVGKPIIVDGTSRIVVGVAPRELEALGRVDLWIPIGKNLALTRRDNHNYGILARLKPGVPVRQAQAEMDGIARRLEQQYPATNAGVGALVIPIDELFSGPIRPALMVLLAAVGFLLLIACANVANLLLARGAVREKEIAVRAALGASRARILRQLLTESLLLGTVGGILGLVLAAWSITALRSALPDIMLIQRLKEMSVDAGVLGFTLAVSIVTGVLFGVVPALRASRADLNVTLKDGGGKGVSGDASQRARTALLVVEVALALVLLVGAGLMVRSFLHVLAVDPGFRADHVLTMQLSLPDSKYHGRPALTNFQRSLISRVSSLSGVRSAATINALPGRGGLLNLRAFVMPFQVDGQPAALPGQEPVADYRVIAPQLLDALGIQVRQGRALNAHDTDDSERVVLINETMARRHYPKVDAVGQRLRFPPFATRSCKIVGVVADARLHGNESAVDPAVFLPYEQDSLDWFTLVVRSSSDPATLAEAVRRQVLSIDPDQPVSNVRTMDDVISESLLIRRLSVWMLGTFAALAMALAVVGIYGLTSYSVSRRTHEIGLRVALGASRGEILRLVVLRGIMTASAGVALGLPCAIVLSRLMRGLLFGVTATDTFTFCFVPLALVSAAALASYVPARRALRIDPIVALRYE